MRWAILTLAVLATTATARAQCPTGYGSCGVTHCTPDGGVCCATVGHEELSCPMGTMCNTDGTCQQGSAACTGQSTATLANCGGDKCGCSAACAAHADCASNCCTTAGFCAPACVCDGTGQLHLNCQGSGLGFTGQPRKSCSATPGDVGSGGWLALWLALPALALLRRRRRA